MSLILKQEPANTIATPPAGKSTLFVDDNSVMAVKSPAGVVTTFPTVQGSNTQVFFNDQGAINGSANLSFVKTTNTLTLTNGNVVATGVKTDNLYYANGNPWDLEQPAGSTNQLQYNDNGSFGASANLTFNGTSLNTTANLNVTGNAYISGNLTVDGNVVYVNVESLSVEDPLIALGGGPNGNALVSNNGYDRGLILHNYTTQAVDAFMGWDTSNAEFSFASNVTVSGEVVTINTLGNVRANRIAGTLTTAAQPNITSVGTLTGLLVGSTSAQVDFPNAKAIMSQDNSGQTHSENIGVVGEAVADSGNTSTWGIGVLGEARANGATKATGVQGGGYVTNSADTGAAVGVRGYSIQTHSGGYNIGVLGNASGSGLGSYAFYVQAGNIGSIETATTWDLVDNSATALTFQSTGKANIFGIETTDGAEGIYTQGYLNVTGNAAVGGLLTNNLYYANGSPWDLQQPGGSNSQIQFNDADQFGGSAAFTFNKTSNTVQLGGVLSVVGNANIGNIGTGGLFTATGNVTGGNLNTGGVVSATGNITGGNVIGTLLTGTLSTAAQPNVTSVGTLTSVSVSGNANVGNIGAAAGVFTTVAGSLTTASQPNVTSVGTLTSVSVSGNANIGNIGTGGLITATGNLNAGNIITGGIVSATGNGTFGNVTATTFTGALSGAATTAGTVTTAAQPNITSVGTLTSLGVNGTVTAVAFTANTGVFTGNANGLSSIQGANLVGTIPSGVVPTLNQNTTGYAATVSGAAQANITSVGTLTSVSVSGNATVGNISATNHTGTTANITGQYITTLATGTAPFVVTSTTQVANLSVATAGLATYATTANAVAGANVSGTVSSATTAGTVTTAAQPNITSLGTLTGLTIGNATANSVFGNGTITLNAGLITGNGAGLSQLAGANVTGTVSAATTAGTVTTAAQPNITSVGTLSALSVTATITGSVSGTAATITTAAQPNITSVGTLTSVSVSGNATVGNISATNHTGTTANITGQYISTLVTGTAPLVVSSTTQVANLNAATAGLATFATTANAVAGANVSGAVSFATTANSVAGANVSGTVSSATSATTAGTVTTAAQPNITSVGTLSGLSVTATITGSVSGSAGTAGTVTTAAQPNITSVSGSFTSLTFANAQTITANNVTFTTGANTNAGTFTGNFSLSAGSKLNATYADLAEKYVADAKYAPGTVLVFGGEHEVTLATEEDSTRVAGVVTTNPAYTMNSACEGEHVAEIALQGRVPVKVLGPVSKGDLLVSGANGHATANNLARAGTIIGKSLENFTEASGVIEVAVGRF
jgi:hypothetical protein